MKKRIIILVFVLILASILRLYKIGEVPYDQAADYIDTIGHYTEVKWLYDNIFVKHNFNFHNLVHYNLAGVKTDFYFSLPFYIILHNNLSLHVTSFIFEILTIVFLYLFTKEFLDEKTALIASFLYAILPSAIEWHRYVLEHSKFSFFAVFSLFLFYRWNKTKQKKYLFFTASTMGFALSVHMSFIFFICSFLTFITIEKLLSKNMKFNSRDVNYFLTGFTIGALLLIINTILFF